MAKYYYDGPVLMFDHVIAKRWSSQTTAPSEAKAKINLAYQFKKQHDKEPTAKVILPGKLRQIG